MDLKNQKDQEDKKYRTINTEKGTFFVRINIRDLFGFADQEKITYDLYYSLTSKRNNNNNNATIRDGGVNAAKIDIKDIGWYIPHYIQNPWKKAN